MSSDEQVELDFEYQGRWSRLLALVKTLLVLPHYVVLLVLALGAMFVYVISWFAVLFTGRYPQGLFTYMVGVSRYGARVAAYVFQMTDRYPPFSMADDPSYPVHLSVAYPQRVGRWRIFFASLLAFPVAIGAGIMMLLAYVAVFVAWLAILFTGRYPQGLFNFVGGALRWSLKVNLYSSWMTTKYPLSPAA